jgi:hypothetical protein
VVLFEDQSRSNPMPDEDDPAGSLVDAAMLSEYVYLGAQRVGCYPGHTVVVMAAFDSKRVLVLSPPAAGFPNSSNAPIDLTRARPALAHARSGIAAPIAVAYAR